MGFEWLNLYFWFRYGVKKGNFFLRSFTCVKAFILAVTKWLNAPQKPCLYVILSCKTITNIFYWELCGSGLWELVWHCSKKSYSIYCKIINIKGHKVYIIGSSISNHWGVLSWLKCKFFFVNRKPGNIFSEPFQPLLWHILLKKRIFVYFIELAYQISH